MPSRTPILLLIGSLVACRQTPTYTGTGDVLAVEAQRLQVTIRHDDVPGLMPAMTMDFPVASREVLSGVSAGARIHFDLRRDGDRLTITRMQPADIAQGARPGLHDHRPHHGGVVAMAGLLHLEATASADGLVRVYLTDVWRRPLPLTGVAGSVRLDVPDGPSRTMVLAERAGALEATGPPLPGSEVIAQVSIMRDGQSLDFHYALPLRAGAIAAALIPSGGCSPPPAAADTEGRRPRCILVFPNRITAVATASNASVALGGMALRSGQR